MPRAMTTLAAAGAAAALAAAVTVTAGPGGDGAVSTASAQSPGAFRVTPQQLRINQRISQAAVRRSNEGLGLLSPVRPQAGQPGPGWTTEHLRGGAVTEAKLAEGLRAAAVPLWAVVNAAGDPPLRGRGVVAVEELGPEAGTYRVRFDRPVAGCSWTASPAAETPGVPPRLARLDRGQTDDATVVVRMHTAAGAPIDAGFHLQVLC